MRLEEIQKIEKRAEAATIKNLASGLWTVETAQFFLQRVHTQPEEFYFLIS